MGVSRMGFATQAGLQARKSNGKSVQAYKVQLNRQLDPFIAKETPTRSRKGPLIFGGLALYCFTAYGTYLYFSSQRAKVEGAALNVPQDVSDRYKDTAKHFDRDVDRTEKLMGIGWLRQSLAKRASGHVLEVSVGTGRNARYYDLKKCKSITMVDQSAEMIGVAKKKFNGMTTSHIHVQLPFKGSCAQLKCGLLELHPQYKASRFLIQSAHKSIPCPSTGGFDTVVQTMGLCSTPNPSELLTHLGDMTNPAKGRILLLEHGRSHYAWLNRILDNSAPAHANKHGCWWNRDIGKMVEESGLEVVKIKRYHLGTTWWVELKPKWR